MGRSNQMAGGTTRFRLLIAWAAIDAAVGTYLALYGSNAVSGALLVGGVVALALALFVARREGRDVQVPATLLLAAHLVVAAIHGYRPADPPPPDSLRLLPLVALALLLPWLVPSVRRRVPTGVEPVIPWLVIGCGLLFRALIVTSDIAPPFDVPLIQEVAGRALLHGTDPYLTTVYHGGYPYLPFAAIAAAAGDLFGDARWAGWIGDLLTVIGIVLFARRHGASRDLGFVTAGMWAWWSGGPYVTWQGFPEPILIGLMMLSAAALVGRDPRPLIGGILLGLAVATKQFGFALLPFLPWRSMAWHQARTWALGTALLVLIPFALWHPGQFFDGTVLSHVREPGRDYALNVLNWPGLNLDVSLVLGFPMALAFGWLCSRRQSTLLSTWLAGSVGLLVLWFVVNRIAFVNYYAIPLALLLVLILALDGDDRTAAAN